MQAIGDESLRPIDNVFIAFAARGGFDSRQVRASPRFRHRDGRYQFALAHSGKPVAFLFLGAEGEDVMTDNTLNAGAETDPRSREFFVYDSLMGECPASTAVFFWNVRE